jgi:hypothetical protein
MFGMFGMPYGPIFKEDFEKSKKDINPEILAILAKNEITIDDVIDRKFGFVSFSRLKEQDNFNHIANEDKIVIINNMIKLEQEMMSAFKRLKKVFDKECESFVIKETFSMLYRPNVFKDAIKSHIENIEFFKSEIKKYEAHY